MRWVILYLIAGSALAVICDRRRREPRAARRVACAVLCGLLWPLWAPVAFCPDPPTARCPIVASRLYTRMSHALSEARSAVLGTPLEALLPDTLVVQVLGCVMRIEQRSVELNGYLSRPQLLADAELWVDSQPSAEAQVETESHSDRAAVPLRVSRHATSRQRLQHLLERDARTLSELATVVEALRLQLVLARYSGERADGVRAVLSELGAQLESVDEWFSLMQPEPVAIFDSSV